MVKRFNYIMNTIISFLVKMSISQSSFIPLQGWVSKTWLGQLPWFSMAWMITALDRAWRPVDSKLRPSRQISWQELQVDHCVKWQSPEQIIIIIKKHQVTDWSWSTNNLLLSCCQLYAAMQNLTGIKNNTSVRTYVLNAKTD